jgi:hypothetical protein
MRLIYLLITLFLLISPNWLYAQKDKFQVNGASRAFLFSNELDIDDNIDTTTAKKSNYGHTLLDLGFSIFPNNNTEIISIFRIRNEIGGFWGGGTSFNVRQLSLKGVAGNKVKYELGDIDLKMTPYTLFNSIEEGVINESDVFAVRREITYYDLFYNRDNTWRMQGAKADFGLNFSKTIKEINFKGFITRQRATDGILIPERLYGGGVVNIIESDNLQIGFNSINLFDLTKTIQDSIKFSNSVHTTTLNYHKETTNNLELGFQSEAGISYSNYRNYNDIFVPEKNNDWFYDAALTGNFKKENIKINLGYKDVGADFIAPGAQTKRINFARTPSLFQQFTNDFVPRPLSYLDFINGNSENSYRITEQLMAYNVAYNNTNPYGEATPNRRGVYLEATKNDTTKFRRRFLSISSFSESRGTGTNLKKNFLVVRGGTDIYVNDFFNMKKDIKINLGLQYESTNRKGREFEQINLNSTFLDAGISLEMVSDFYLLFGYKMWTAKGNEYVVRRNQYNTVMDLIPTNINFVEQIYATGLKYNFSKRNALTIQYEMYNITHKNNLGVNYGINQFNLLYSLMF